MEALDGESILPLLSGSGSMKRDAIYWHFPASKGLGASGAIRKGDWKLVEFFDDGRVELFNLKDDLSEANDLSRSNPDKTKELLDALKAWRTKLGADMPSR